MSSNLVNGDPMKQQDFFGRDGFPVLILGAPRTGTSTLLFGVRKLGFRGDAEGHWLTLLGKIMLTIDQHFVDLGGTAWDGPAGNSIPHNIISAQRFGHSVLKSRLTFDFLADCYTSFGTSWVAKTPSLDMYTVVPYLLRFQPKLRIIYAFQRPDLNVSSRLRKFPSESVEEHCGDYAQHIHRWLALRSTLDPSSYLEISPGASGFGVEGWNRVIEFLKRGDSSIHGDAAELANLRIEHSRIEGQSLETSLLPEKQRKYFESVAVTAYRELADELGDESLLHELDQEIEHGNSITLPLTPGVRSVELALADGHAWNEVDEAGTWLFIHGPTVPNRARVAWRFTIPPGRWDAEFTVQNRGGFPQHFHFSGLQEDGGPDGDWEPAAAIEPGPANELHFDDRCNFVLSPASTYSVRVALPAESGRAGVTIGVTPKHVSNEQSWVRLTGLRLTRATPAAS